MGAVSFEPQGNVEEFGLFESKGSFDCLLHISWTPRYRLARKGKPNSGRGLFLMPMLAVDLRFDWLDSDTSGLGIDDFEISGDLVLDGGLRLEWVY